jgi:hypothetical protein
MTPRRLTPPLQSLPPMLHSLGEDPMLAYSQGSRGLSVSQRVGGICTTTLASPSPSLRQCSSDYAIHARRNLPDKELRYLRTVIVTAAVSQSFGSELHLLSEPRRLTHPLNFLAPGRRRSVYVVFRTSHRAVFLVNSSQSRFAAAASGFGDFTPDPTRGDPSPEVTEPFCRVP